MNLRRKKPHDSLYMLLDTMCNAFGGIILLAVLVVVLTSREKSQIATASESQEMLQRRFAIAQENLVRSLQIQTALQSKASETRWKTQVSLLATRQGIQDEIKTIRELAAQNAKELEAFASSDPADRLKELNVQLSVAQTQRTDAQNSLAASKDNVKRLNSRFTSLEKQASDLVRESRRQLRLPIEHETSKRVIYVIARYGRIYPCRNSDLSRNETDIEWSSRLTSEIAEPRRSNGIDPFSNMVGLKSYFKNLSENSVYVAFCVFEDSFPAFLRAKQAATDSGLSYGWDPFQLSDEPVAFSAVGHTPKPQ